MQNKINISFNGIADKLEKIQKQNYKLFVGWNNPGMAKIAKLHEYGGVSETPKGWITHIKKVFNIDIPDTLQIPPRPHRLKALTNYKDKWVKNLSTLLLRNNFDVEKSFEQLALIMRQDYLQVLFSGDFKELWWVTLEMRKVKNIRGTAPLVATREMQRQLTAEVYRD